MLSASKTSGAFFFAALLLLGCSGAPDSQLPDGGQQPLSVDSAGPATVLPGTWVQVRGQGFTGLLVSEVTVVLHGGGDRPVTPEHIEPELLKFRVEPSLFSSLGGPGPYNGNLEVQVNYQDGSWASESLDVTWTLVDSLQPEMQSFSPSGAIVYLGSPFQAQGAGFLMEGEGTTELRFTGSFLPEGSADPVSLNRSCGFVSTRRDLLDVPFSADCFGIQPGTFTGYVKLVNVHTGGAEVNGTELSDVTIELGKGFLSRVEPMSASRGQKVSLQGRGFVGGEAITTVRFEGTFTDSRGQVTQLEGEDALEIVPDILPDGNMEYVLRVEPDGRGGVKGLGAKSGTLRGTGYPVVYHQGEVEEGFPLHDVTFLVLPQRQVVFLKYLPGFRDALRDFGMHNVEHLVKARILEVFIRDYQGINVEIREARPTDFVEYAVLEIGGRDPNGRDLIGLDNTMGKDTGNIYFDDIAGGWNADSAENGNAAFGGVFVSSFLGFSEKAPEPMPLAHPEFDRVFSPFMPSQGGQLVEVDEYPGGERSAQIEEAIHCLGTMIGTTSVHEIGHTLGLAAGPPDMFHNLVPDDNQLMDAGIYREFEERAELNGKGPGLWTNENRAYLEAILPVE